MKPITLVSGPGPYSDRMHELWGTLPGYYQAHNWTIYCYGTHEWPSHDIIEHEIVHFEQQDVYGDPDVWWECYLTDSEFRLAAEVEAYGKDIQAGRIGFEYAVLTLSGPLYGMIPAATVARRLQSYLLGCQVVVLD